MTKKILVVYCNRAEEGMLNPIMKRIENDKDLELIELNLLPINQLGMIHYQLSAKLNIKEIRYIL